MPDYVLADEFRELTGIPIAPFVPLEQRPTNALYPAAREALKDPDQLKVLNEILQKNGKVDVLSSISIYLITSVIATSTRH